MRQSICLMAPAIWAAMGASAAELPQIPGLTLAVETIPSSMDGTPQPVVVGIPEGYDGSHPLPLLIGLHTWSAGYLQRVEPYGRQAARRGWLMILPHFRGPNTIDNPQATHAGGSLIAQHDIVDAYRYMIEHYNVDRDRVYLTGDSGGGHMTMLMAGKYPDLWAAAAAFVPVTDLREWWEEQNGYAKHVEAVTGGKPGDGPAVDFEYLRRSPRTFMTNLAHVPLLLAHGDRDATIPVEQTWRTFRVLAGVPRHRTTLHVFSGGHTADHDFALDWLSQHVRSGDPPAELHLVTDESKWYYWAYLRVAEPLRLGTADIVLADDVLSVSTRNLAALMLDLEKLPLPDGGLFLAVRNDRPLELTLRKVPAGVCVEPDTTVEVGIEDDEGITLTFPPSEETRSLRLTW